MRLMDFLIPEAIEPSLKSTNKTDAIKELVALLKITKAISDEESVARVVLEREELGSTGIGEGIAVPHGKSSDVDKVIAAFGRSEKGINFESETDDIPVKLIFLLIAPAGSSGPHLLALARISRLLRSKDFREKLIKAKSKSDILNIFKSEE
ncbi:TPA: PTS sugar transporter subunit IIA [bacterium]|jgi:PTS system nitrogen regulatory IIA component|nr:PTS sugar transporter subunit IIA [bacterium]